MHCRRNQLNFITESVEKVQYVHNNWEILTWSWNSLIRPHIGRFLRTGWLYWPDSLFVAPGFCSHRLRLGVGLTVKHHASSKAHQIQTIFGWKLITYQTAHLQRVLLHYFGQSGVCALPLGVAAERSVHYIWYYFPSGPPCLYGVIQFAHIRSEIGCTIYKLWWNALNLRLRQLAWTPS